MEDGFVELDGFWIDFIEGSSSSITPLGSLEDPSILGDFGSW